VLDRRKSGNNYQMTQTDLAVYWKTSSVRYSMMLLMRLPVMGDFWDLAMDKSKISRNCLSDVWYITFTIDISTITKYRMLPRTATTHKRITYHDDNNNYKQR
jgi:hypothetical protein